MSSSELSARESWLSLFCLIRWHSLHNNICCCTGHYSAVRGLPSVQDLQVLNFAIPHFPLWMFASLIWLFCQVIVNLHLSCQPANQPGLCSVSSLWLPAPGWNSLARSMIATVYICRPWKEVALESDSGYPGATFWISPPVFIHCKVTALLTHTPQAGDKNL